MRPFSCLVIAAMVCGAVPALAESEPDRKGPPPGGHHQPPPEAFTACADKTEGIAVTLTMPDGKTMAATCAKSPDGRLAARPNDMPDRKGPPPEPR